MQLLYNAVCVTISEDFCGALKSYPWNPEGLIEPWLRTIGLLVIYYSSNKFLMIVTDLPKNFPFKSRLIKIHITESSGVKHFAYRSEQNLVLVRNETIQNL